MKISALGPLIAILTLAVVLVTQSAYIVDETEQVIITQFGEPIGGAITTPGLKFRIPFIRHVHRFNKRLLEWDGNPERMPTKDKKYLWIDTTARWRIKDPLKFMKTVGIEVVAQTRLDDLLDGATRSAIANHDLINMVRSTNRILDAERAEDVDFEYDFPNIELGREDLVRELAERVRPAVEGFGIELVDIRIKRVNYEAEVRNKVFERMISERRRVAEKLRAEGQGATAQIQGEKEKELKKIESEAYRIAQEIKGTADAEAVRIYAEAYSKDPEFYAFFKTLESYADVIKDQDTLILTTDNEFFSYLKQSSQKV